MADEHTAEQQQPSPVKLAEIVNSRLVIPSASMLSPYDSREYIEKFCTLSTNERATVAWGLYQNVRTRKHPVHAGDIFVTKRALASLQPGEYVEDMVVDMLGRSLNQQHLQMMQESGQKHVSKFCIPVHAFVSNLIMNRLVKSVLQCIYHLVFIFHPIGDNHILYTVITTNMPNGLLYMLS